MVSDVAISVERLSKRYMIGGKQHQWNMRDSIDEFLRHPFGIGAERHDKEEFWALNDVSFEIKKGDVVGIIGRNGSGKSTLLKILTRIVEPTKGKITMRGRVASLLEVGTGFNAELTGRENIFLNGAILGMSQKEIAGKFDEIVAFSGVEQFIDTPVKRYSSGMYVRLAFSVAAHLDSDILLVDEVLAVGDQEFQKKCLGKMDSLAKSGKTVLFVSHNMAAVKTLCNSGIHIKNGNVIDIGQISKVCKSYENANKAPQPEMSGSSTRSLTKTMPFYISRIELMDAHDHIASDYSAGESFAIHIWFNGSPPQDNFTVEYKLHNSTGSVVSFGTANPMTNVFFKKGDSHVKCLLGPLPLTCGDYSLSFSVRVWGQERWDNWENALFFHIIHSDMFGTGHNVTGDVNGDFVINQQWTTIVDK